VHRAAAILAGVVRGLLFLLLGWAAFAAEPGKFDYYLLSLSWSPDYCSGHAGDAECGGTRKYGFVVHGLWPQYERGFPGQCPGRAFDAGQVPASLPAVMPSSSLQRHEWSRHGTCSGLPQMEYFQTLERAFQKVTIPPPYRQPIEKVEVAPRQIRENFERANPSFPHGAFALQCPGGGRYLSEVRVCFTRDLEPRACAADIRDTCRADTVIMRPLR